MTQRDDRGSRPCGLGSQGRVACGSGPILERAPAPTVTESARKARPCDGGESAHNLRFGGRAGAQPMVDVRDGEAPLAGRREARERIQERRRIRAAAACDEHRFPAQEHAPSIGRSRHRAPDCGDGRGAFGGASFDTMCMVAVPGFEPGTYRV